jgi:hypothetical protein
MTTMKIIERERFRFDFLLFMFMEGSHAERTVFFRIDPFAGEGI